MSPSYHPPPVKYTLSPSLSISLLTLKLKIILFNRRIYIIVLFKKKKPNTTETLQLVANSGFPQWPTILIPRGEDLRRWHSPTGKLGKGDQAVSTPRRGVPPAEAGRCSSPSCAQARDYTLICHLSQARKAVKRKAPKHEAEKRRQTGVRWPVIGKRGCWRCSEFQILIKMKKKNVNLECHDFLQTSNDNKIEEIKLLAYLTALNRILCPVKKLAYVPMWVYANVYTNISP